jgi:hypothetical protein
MFNFMEQGLKVQQALVDKYKQEREEREQAERDRMKQKHPQEHDEAKFAQQERDYG